MNIYLVVEKVWGTDWERQENPSMLVIFRGAKTE